jgi:hypothetical protein
VNVPLWVTERAAEFWAATGGPEPFPRRLRGPAGRAFVFTVVDRPGLSVAGALDWLARAGVSCELGTRDRPLRACLVAAGGAGFAFIDADDPEDERRFSLAHELAHFLRDYWRPRRAAERRLGPAVLEVFDGRRPPRPEERLHGLLRGVCVGYHTHLMARDAGPTSAAVAAAERAADRLAYELLAPASAVLTGGCDGLEHRLVAEFGLPAAHAAQYAGLLTPPAPRADPLILRLRG